MGVGGGAGHQVLSLAHDCRPGPASVGVDMNGGDGGGFGVNVRHLAGRICLKTRTRGCGDSGANK